MNEIDTRPKSDLNQYTGFQLFTNEFDYAEFLGDVIDIDRYGFYFVSDTDKMNRVMIDAAKKNKKMPKDIQNMITKTFGKTIRSTGDIVITLQNDGEYDNSYHMFDFSKPVKMVGRTDYDKRPVFEVNFYVGHILTDNVQNEYYYSPKKQLGLSNIQQVHLSELGKEYRGQGYGAMLYDTVAKQVDAIYSDSTLFKGSLAMWTKHMRKISKFFGAVLQVGVIVPVSGEIDKKVIDAADGFVSIFTKVPPKLKEMEQFLSGIPVDNIFISGDIDNREISFKRMTDTLDRVATLSEFGEQLDYDVWPNYTAGIFLHEKTTFVVKEVGEELDYMII